MYRLLWLAALAVPVMSQATDMTIHAVRHGESFEFEAVSEFEADLVQVWEVLTDYDRFSDFIPGMQTSQIIARDPRNVVVDQRGEVSLLFFTFPIRVRLAIEEYPYRRIISRAIKGDFKELRGVYNLEAHGRRIRLFYSGQVTPNFSVPPLISTILVRHIVEKRFSAMVDEILRRQRARNPQALSSWGWPIYAISIHGVLLRDPVYPALRKAGDPTKRWLVR